MTPKTSQELARFFDHTLLRANATTNEIKQLCAEARQNHFAAVCVNPAYLPLVRQELIGIKVLAAVVVGFPLGANASTTKADETAWVVDNGAQEIDMVINVGAYLSGAHDVCYDDIKKVITTAGKIPVKVILETAYLTPAMIVDLTKRCADMGAAFVKTSSGFAPRGASVEDIQTMAETLKVGGYKKVGIKASGGIKDWATASAMIAAGATRIGSSSSVQILQAFQKS